MVKTNVFKAPEIWKVSALIILQTICSVVFIGDVSGDLIAQGGDSLTNPANLSEIVASFGLILGLVFETFVLWWLIGRHNRMQDSLKAASGALSDLMENYFRTWALTPTEADVATFTIKGYSITEIAKLRGSAEGTIKTHLNAIYRKSGVTGRAQLVSVLIEDLFRGTLLGVAGEKPHGA
ncbi:MAG: helix-turn-helix transcriptional regulator [Pseudomonadota bacterium]